MDASTLEGFVLGRFVLQYTGVEKRILAHPPYPLADASVSPLRQGIL